MYDKIHYKEKKREETGVDERRDGNRLSESKRQQFQDLEILLNRQAGNYHLSELNKRWRTPKILVINSLSQIQMLRLNSSPLSHALLFLFLNDYFQSFFMC